TAENCSSSSFGTFGNSRSGFFLVGIHAPLTHVMPEHKISDTLGACRKLCSAYEIERRPRGASRVNPLPHLLQRAKSVRPWLSALLA
ncbi:hypothetical protein, partial [Pseudomonas sp. CM25]|uniref:hypothetical protein n=1 Tax=Pseudomonas sp. CM25 TaxID=2738448 RepID=UPI001C499586